MKPNVNEVWITKEGRLCLIVDVPEMESDQDKESIGMLWFDDIYKEWTVSKIYSRLVRKTNLTPAEFFRRLS